MKSSVSCLLWYPSIVPSFCPQPFTGHVGQVENKADERLLRRLNPGDSLWPPVGLVWGGRAVSTGSLAIGHPASPLAQHLLSACPSPDCHLLRAGLLCAAPRWMSDPRLEPGTRQELCKYWLKESMTSPESLFLIRHSLPPQA